MANIQRIKEAVELFENGTYVLDMDCYIFEDYDTDQIICCLAGVGYLMTMGIENTPVKGITEIHNIAKTFFELNDFVAIKLFEDYTQVDTTSIPELKDHIEDCLGIQIWDQI